MSAAETAPEHAAWVARAAPPAGVVLAREEGLFGADDYIDIVRRSGLERPLDDRDRVARMVAHSNLLVTAREAADGRLVGLARSVTDFAFCCYLSDLCVDEGWKGKGIGRALIGETKRIVGARSMLLLLSAAEPMTYYPAIGMAPVGNGFIIRREA